GVFVTPNLEIGAQIGLSSSVFANESSVGTSEYKHTSSAWGVYSQKYFPIAEKFIITVAGSISYVRGTDKSHTVDASGTINNQEGRHGGATVAVGPSLTFLPSDHWALQLKFGNLSYSFEKYS